MPVQKKSKTHADAVVIGAGPGGYVAAIRLAQMGQNVTVIEKGPMGGVCLNWGCIPSKALIYAASLYEKVSHAEEMGIVADNLRVDMATLQDWKGGVVKKLTGGIGQLLKANGVTVIQGEASFVDSHTLNVKQDDDQSTTVSFDNVIIATGSCPVSIPGFEVDGKHVVGSRDALAWTKIPKSLAIIGGGVIGLEIGILYAKLGTAVTVVEMMPQLLAGTDPDIVAVLARSLKKRGVTVHTSAKAKQVHRDGNTPSLSFDTAKGETQTIKVDHILVAVGRQPNSNGLNLEAAGVKTDKKGFILVDQYLRSNVPHIYAIGDVTPGPLLAHRASKQGTVAAEIIAGSQQWLDYRALPAAVFTDPEIATVGLSQEEAEKEGYQVTVGQFPFQASGRALSMNEPVGMVKVVADAKTDQVLGVHMVGPDVSELIAEAALAIELGATAEDIALTVHTHPTLPESMMEAAEAVHGKAIHVYQKDKKPAGRAKAAKA